MRWATPVIHFRRTAMADTVVGGQEIKAGEKVVMFYNSANRDERAFDDPFRFDVHAHAERARRLRRRRPALLPRRQPRPPRDPRHVRGAVPPPARHRDHRRARHLQSNFIHGIKRMPCTWHTVLQLGRSRLPARTAGQRVGRCVNLGPVGQVGAGVREMQASEYRAGRDPDRRVARFGSRSEGRRARSFFTTSNKLALRLFCRVTIFSRARISGTRSPSSKSTLHNGSPAPGARWRRSSLVRPLRLRRAMALRSHSGPITNRWHLEPSHRSTTPNGARATSCRHAARRCRRTAFHGSSLGSTTAGCES